MMMWIRKPFWPYGAEYLYRCTKACSKCELRKGGAVFLEGFRLFCGSVLIKGDSVNACSL